VERRTEEDERTKNSQVRKGQEDEGAMRKFLTLTLMWYCTKVSVQTSQGKKSKI
jgi:hypothetical protein